MTQSSAISATTKPFASLYEFVKAHLLIVNAVVLFSTFVVGVLDFLVPAIKPILVLIYWFTGILSVLMLLAAVFPERWTHVMRHFNFGQVNGEGPTQPMHQRAAWRGAIVLLIGITLAGVVSLAKASQGGAIVNAVPALKEIQVSLLSLSAKSDKIQTGVDSANAKLDRIAEAVDPNNPADRCPDLECALVNGASRKTLEKLWDKGGRLPGSDVLLADLMNRVMHTKGPSRLDTIDFLMEHDFPAEVKISPLVLDPKELPQKGIPLMTEAWQAADLSRNPTTKFTRVAQGDQSFNAWNDMAGCIVRTSGGMTPIQLAAITGDQELFVHLAKRGVKVTAQPISCKWKAGMDIPRPGHAGEFSARAMTGQVAIKIDEKGHASVVAQR